MEVPSRTTPLLPSAPYNEPMPFPFFLRVAYLGTAFHGWQIQTSARSVQGDLGCALRSLDPEAPLPQGTGRTDAGVHARAQGVLVVLRRAWDPYRLLAALNAHLPADVRVMAAQPAPEGFWPRQHAVAKRYRYRIQEGPASDPFEHGRSWHVHGAERLDRAAMEIAAGALVGTHDFSSFRHQECAARSPIRTIHQVRLEPEAGGFSLVFEGDRFLMHQVRIMTGTLVEVGKGRRGPLDLPEILAARQRSRAGITAPPDGLWLDEVWYQTRWGLGPPCPWGDPTTAGPDSPSS